MYYDENQLRGRRNQWKLSTERPTQEAFFESHRRVLQEIQVSNQTAQNESARKRKKWTDEPTKPVYVTPKLCEADTSTTEISNSEVLGPPLTARPYNYDIPLAIGAIIAYVAVFYYYMV